MAIRKQEFYEGAALHLLARAGAIAGLRYEAPFFLFNGQASALVKYCTRGRSPWGFTFAPDEQLALSRRALGGKTIIALVCGSDGVAALTYQQYETIAPQRPSALHVACYRRSREQYEVKGPDGTLTRKVALSDWQKILES